MNRPELVNAKNKHCCALACVVAVARAYKIHITQDELLEGWGSKFPKWATHPGELTGGELIELCESLFTPKGVYFSNEKKAIRESLSHPDAFAGFVMTKKERHPDGHLVELIHCRAIAAHADDGLTLMDPKRLGAEEKKWDWEELLVHCEGAAMVLHK